MFFYFIVHHYVENVGNIGAVISVSGTFHRKPGWINGGFQSCLTIELLFLGLGVGAQRFSTLQESISQSDNQLDTLYILDTVLRKYTCYKNVSQENSNPCNTGVYQ